MEGDMRDRTELKICKDRQKEGRREGERKKAKKGGREEGWGGEGGREGRQILLPVAKSLMTTSRLASCRC